MSISLRGILSKVALSGWLILGTAGIAHAEGEVPAQIWPMNYKAAQTKQRQAKYDLPTFKLESGRVILNTNAETRLETELQTTVDLKDLPKVKQLMDELVADPAKTETLLGKGYAIVQLNKKPRDMADPYYDTPDAAIAASGGSLRVRIENGVAKVNFKPPTAERFDNGVAHRIEAGIDVQLDANGQISEKTIAFLTNPRLVDNPLREFKKFYPKVDLANLLRTGRQYGLGLKQERAIYEVQLNGTRVNELSVDHVKEENGRGEFGSFEGEGDHLALVPTAAQLAKVQASQQTGWKGPHKGEDTRNPAMVGTRDPKNPGVLGPDASPDVKQVHMVADALQAHFKAAGVNIVPAGKNKYVRMRELLGMSAGKAPVGGKR